MRKVLCLRVSGTKHVGHLYIATRKKRAVSHSMFLFGKQTKKPQNLNLGNWKHWVRLSNKEAQVSTAKIAICVWGSENHGLDNTPFQPLGVALRGALVLGAVT